MSDPDRIFRALQGQASLVVRRLQLRLWQVLSSGTPVDTGFARGNWTPSVGAEPSFEQGRGAGGGINRPSDEEAARRIAAQRFSQNKQEAARIALSYDINDGTVFLVNPVVYMEFLNQGSSVQAPAMFVEEGIEEAIDATRKEFGGLLG